jgi:hypothetical protein
MKRRPLVASLVSSLAAILILAAGCGEQSPTATRLEPTGVAAARAGVGKRVQPARARYHAGRFSTTIGPSGGVLSFRIGTLIVPQGALSTNTQITARVDGEELAVEFEPHGLTFRRGHEPTLLINYRNIQRSERTMYIQYVDSSMYLLEELPTLTDKASKIAWAPIEHFSIYCLAE